MRPLRSIQLVASTVLLFAPANAGAADPASLRKWISLRFPGLSWTTTAELSGWLERPEPGAPPIVLLDARAPAEFEVSHLAGALRVDPEASGPDLPALPPEARVVVYCSVGYRSGAIAKRLGERGVERVYNLDGGIFLWANQGLPVVRAGQPVRQVHPFGGRWARYLDESLHAAE